MAKSRSARGLRYGFLVFCLLALAGGAMGQGFKEYIKPASAFPNLLSPYVARRVPEPSFGNTTRIEDLLQAGKLRLSLTDAVALALENNLDLAIARYNLSIADTDVLRAKSGQSVRGVATGLVQGTPGGGIGGFGSGAPGAGAGGTSGGAGGAGGGASGLVQSTLGIGAPIDSYDPQVFSNVSVEHLTEPLSNSIVAGVSNLKQNSTTANFSYFQGFRLGTSMEVDFNNSRTTDNSTNSTLVPQINSGFRFTLRQKLLAGWGLGPNMRFIRIAHNNREISDVAFRNQVIATVSQIQNIYWDLVSAYEDVKVKERSLSLAEKTVSDDREQLRLGALAPIEVTKAESEVASRNEDLLLSQNTLQLQELLIKNAITRDLSDPVLASADVVPTDTMNVPEDALVQPVQDLLNDAASHRPELAEARMDLTNRDITRKAAANALLPSVDLVGWYGASGLAGEQNLNNPVVTPPIPRSGFPNAFASLFRNDFPDYGVAVNVNIPLRNRQAQLRLQQLQNQIAIEVRNAQFALQQNRVRAEAAHKARNLARRTFDIEVQKQALGASSSNVVLQTQRDLAQAESNYVAAMATYEKSIVELDRSTGLTLTHTGIEIEDAEKGEVRQLPHFYGVAPRKDLQAEPASKN